MKKKGLERKTVYWKKKRLKSKNGYKNRFNRDV
jgi:hypothetical protein